MTEILTVLTTTDSAAKAEALARGAVAERVAACAQINGPVTSVYRWEGAVQTDPEWQVLFKTAAGRYEALEAYIRRAHDYDVPEIIATPVPRAGADYAEWVVCETAETGGEGRMRESGTEALPFFVYGTLRPGQHHYAWALRGRTVREEPARMRGMVLYEGPGYPYALAAPEGEVHGDLVLPDPAHYNELLRVIDRLEGYAPGDPDNLYERVAAEAVRPDGTAARAWVYLAAAPLAAKLRAGGTVIAGGDWASRAG